jgi:hypothetical protein
MCVLLFTLYSPFCIWFMPSLFTMHLCICCCMWGPTYPWGSLISQISCIKVVWEILMDTLSFTICHVIFLHICLWNGPNLSSQRKLTLPALQHFHHYCRIPCHDLSLASTTRSQLKQQQEHRCLKISLFLPSSWLQCGLKLWIGTESSDCIYLFHYLGSNKRMGFENITGQLIKIQIKKKKKLKRSAIYSLCTESWITVDLLGVFIILFFCHSFRLLMIFLVWSYHLGLHRIVIDNLLRLDF